jgi:two-component system, NarL family, nitrate/nitrite response regulator NarL
MSRVVIIAASAAARQRLHMLLAAPGIEIVDERANLRDLSDEHVDVAVIAGDQLVTDGIDWTLSRGGRVGVVGLVEDAGFAPATLDRLKGWAILPSHVHAAELRAGVSAAAVGLGVRPAGWRPRRHDGPALSEGIDDPLTPREQEVLELLSFGLSNRRIAARLGISEHTVKFHVAAIYGKLGVSGRTAAVNRALRQGLLKI